ncbi:BZ3501_MvSof-1269-A2-R1_Chr12-1g03322 [Microbotryum saponariae]|nr:BZ3501_MvSof-1269-A2-R1_Chr12-1g03322 [Microbotryum saponariae]
MCMPQYNPLALRESLLELEIKPLGSPKVEIFAPTPILIDPSIGTMDTTHSNFDPQRITPLVSRNPRNSPAPSSATIGLMPATPPMRLQRVVKGRPYSLPAGVRATRGRWFLVKVSKTYTSRPVNYPYIVGINDDSENDQQKKKNGWTRSRTWSQLDSVSSFCGSSGSYVLRHWKDLQERFYNRSSHISASAQVLANRSARGKNPLSKLRGFAQALHLMSGSQDEFDAEVTCSSCKKKSEIVDPKPCHDE